MKFFHKKSIGLDISDYSIKVVELEKKEKKMYVKSTGTVILAPGIVERGVIQNFEKLKEALTGVCLDAFPSKIVLRNVVFGLPDTLVYTHIFSLKKNDEEKLEDVINEEVEKYIPLARNNLTISSKTLKTKKGGTVCVLTAISTEALTHWQHFFKTFNIQVDIFDTEIFALFRSIYPAPQETSVCIVDMGALTTHVAIFNEGNLRHEYLINTAGLQLTNGIALALKKDKSEAEKLKKEIGLSKQHDPVYSVLIKELKPVVENIKSTLLYFAQQTGEKVEEVVLVGGSSMLKGLPEYIGENIKIPTKLGAQTTVVSDENSQIPHIYIEAVGLALRGLNEYWNKRDPLFLPELKTKNKDNKQNQTTSRASRIPKVPEENKSSNKDATMSEFNLDNSKLHTQKVLLLILLAVGVVVIPLSFWYKEYRNEQKEKDIQARLELLNIQTAILQNNDVSLDDVVDKEQTQKGETVDVPAGQVETKKEEEPKTAVDNESVETVLEDVILLEVRVLIIKTPTGWLNARTGPGVVYKQVTRVYPNEEYQLLEESNGWYKINIPSQEPEGGSGEAIQAWITSQYAIIIN